MQCKQIAHVKGSQNRFHLGVYCVFTRNCFCTLKLYENFVRIIRRSKINVSYKLDTAMQDLQILTAYCFISLSLEEENGDLALCAILL